jgi:hypothetical protein
MLILRIVAATPMGEVEIGRGEKATRQFGHLPNFDTVFRRVDNILQPKRRHRIELINNLGVKFGF